jgi:hypothetical protein
MNYKEEEQFGGRSKGFTLRVLATNQPGEVRDVQERSAQAEDVVKKSRWS